MSSEVKQIVNKGGRPEVKIDWERVDQLLERGCSGTEIAGYFGVHPETFYRRVENYSKMGFTEYLQQKRSKRDTILRETQFNVAEKGNVSMLIWLGKQYLNQREPEPTPDKEYAKGPFNLWWDERNKNKIEDDKSK